MAVYEIKSFEPTLQPKRLHAHFPHSLKVPSRNHSPFCMPFNNPQGAVPTNRKEGHVLGQRHDVPKKRILYKEPI